MQSAMHTSFNTWLLQRDGAAALAYAMRPTATGSLGH